MTERFRKELEEEGVGNLAMDQVNTVFLVEEVHLRVQVFEKVGNELVVNAAYTISGDNGKSYSGTTDHEGQLEHLYVPYGNYTLSVTDAASGKTHKVAIPWVVEDDQLHLQHLPDLSYEPPDDDTPD